MLWAVVQMISPKLFFLPHNLISLFDPSLTIDRVTALIMNSRIVLTSDPKMSHLSAINPVLIRNIDRAISFKMC